jgi:hypothetical protein
MSNHTVEIRGERVTIRYTAIHDLPDLMTLWNDGRVMKWVGFPEGLGYDLDKLMNWYSQLQANPNRHHFVVHEKGTGFCGELYYAADKEHKRAGLDIKLIPETQGRRIIANSSRGHPTLHRRSSLDPSAGANVSGQTAYFADHAAGLCLCFQRLRR